MQRLPRRINEEGLTERPGNPANGLRQAYQKLMAIGDPQELYDAACGIVKQYEGHGASSTHIRKFMATMGEQLRRNSVQGMQKYITNFMLAADGMGVVGGSRGRMESTKPWGRIVNDHRVTIGSMLCEDVTDQFLHIEPWKREIIETAARYGIHIQLAEDFEELDDHDMTDHEGDVDDHEGDVDDHEGDVDDHKELPFDDTVECDDSACAEPLHHMCDSLNGFLHGLCGNEGVPEMACQGETCEWSFTDRSGQHFTLTLAMSAGMDDTDNVESFGAEEELPSANDMNGDIDDDDFPT